MMVWLNTAITSIWLRRFTLSWSWCTLTIEGASIVHPLIILSFVERYMEHPKHSLQYQHKNIYGVLTHTRQRIEMFTAAMTSI